MKDQAWALVKATQGLVAYIEANQVYDKFSDGGCGLYDTYRSDGFDEAIANARKAVGELEQALGGTP